ncbi:MAG TPA: hypothetical protein VMY38_07160 [Gemmatimonadaceae bacterium]|nr:hypothetical protein [Gemmatimonadaceae bacterium]
MGWILRAIVFTAATAMFVHSAWRVARISEARLLRLGQMAFYAALMLLVIPKEQARIAGDWPFWAAFALLLVSFGFTLAHKLRP